MGISSSTGVVSGLDYEAIIQATLEVEKQPLYNMQAEESDYLAQISSYGSIKSAMSGLESASETMKDGDFTNYNASSSDSELVKVSTDEDNEDLAPGTYTMTVENLAKVEILNCYDGFTSSDEVVGTGTLSIATGEGEAVNIDIDEENNTLEGIAYSINESEAGVSAMVVDLGNGSFSLSITSENTGESIDFSVVSDDDGSSDDAGGLSRLYSDPQAGTLSVGQKAEKARIIFNGLPVERSSNSIENLIPGVTVDLVEVDKEKPVTIEVEKSYSSMTSAIGSFVDAYNALISAFDKEQSFDPKTGASGVLFGDYSATTIKNGVNSQLKRTVEGVNEEVGTLSALGIEMEDDGTLSFDTEDFDEILEGNEEDIIRFFINDEEGNEGIALGMFNYVEAYTKSDGLIDQKTESLQVTVDKIEDDIIDEEKDLAEREEYLRDYYNSLEMKLSELDALQSSVTSMLGSIGTTS